MILGIGVDIIDINRFKNIVNNYKLMSKLFTFNEVNFINKDIKKAADNFSAKEAIVKVSKLGFRLCKPTDIEILRDKYGAPVIVLHGKALEFFSDLNIMLHLSISNTDNFSISYVIGEKNE